MKLYLQNSQRSCDGHLFEAFKWSECLLNFGPYFITLQELDEYNSKADTSLTQRQMLLRDGHWVCAINER